MAKTQNESFEDQVSRLESMCYDDGGTWDLSENDTAAIEAVLQDRKRVIGELASLKASIANGVYVRRDSAESESEMARLKDAGLR